MGIFNKIKNIFKKEDNFKQNDGFNDNTKNIELDNKEEDTITIGDMNNSGDITITDVIILLRKYLELE